MSIFALAMIAAGCGKRQILLNFPPEMAEVSADRNTIQLGGDTFTYQENSPSGYSVNL